MKTHLLTKKRALISSVAMLLVAIIALGTATFAWFTQSTKATAKGLNVKTIKASELVISDYQKNWGTTVDYAIVNKVFMPASSSNGTSWYKAEAAKRDEFGAKGLFTPADAPTFDAPTSSSYVYADQLNVKNKGDAKVENVRITWTMPTFESANYLRVALVPADESGNIMTAQVPTESLGTTAAETFQKNIYDADGVKYDAANGTKAQGEATVNDTVSVTPKKTTTVTVGTLSKNQAAFYNLYVWFEGQDVDCYDSNAGQVVPDIEFTVQGETESQV